MVARLGGGRLLDVMAPSCAPRASAFCVAVKWGLWQAPRPGEPQLGESLDADLRSYRRAIWTPPDGDPAGDQAGRPTRGFTIRPANCAADGRLQMLMDSRQFEPSGVQPTGLTIVDAVHPVAAVLGSQAGTRSEPAGIAVRSTVSDSMLALDFA